jgi:hypothetical protein
MTECLCVHLSMLKNILITCLTWCVAMSTVAQTMKAKTAPGVDLTTYSTFTVVKGEVMMSSDEKKIDEAKLFEGIKKGVIDEMQTRGYTYVDDSTAQLAVSYVAGAFNKTESEYLGPMGGTPASSGADLNQSRSLSHNSRQGFLVLDVIDSRSKRELWSVESQVDLSTVDSIRALESIVLRSFKKFPSKLKKKKK